MRATECSDDGDFLWNAALERPPARDRRWIIPDELDLLPPDDDSSSLADYLGRIPFSFSETDKAIVQVVEQRGRGAWDAVGGEVWEAAVLLSCFLQSQLRTADLISSDDCLLELGCGVALPSLLLSQSVTPPPSIIATDHDSKLLNNLRANLARLHGSDAVTMIDSALEIAKLDWSIFAELSAEELDTILPRQLHRQRIDVAFGSALCYAPCHAVLGKLIQYYLSGRCREVIVLQIVDREGFQQLVKVLQELKLDYTLDEVPESIYQHASSVRVRNGGSFTQLDAKDGVGQLLLYDFADHSSAGDAFGNDSNDTKSPPNNGCIRTAREHFGLLRVRSQQLI